MNYVKLGKEHFALIDNEEGKYIIIYYKTKVLYDFTTFETYLACSYEYKDNTYLVLLDCEDYLHLYDFKTRRMEQVFNVGKIKKEGSCDEYICNIFQYENYVAVHHDIFHGQNYVNLIDPINKTLRTLAIAGEVNYRTITTGIRGTNEPIKTFSVEITNEKEEAVVEIKDESYKNKCIIL
jgi:hypothetical protein